MLYIGLKYPRSKAIYEEINKLTDLISKFMQFFMVDVSVSMYVLPISIYSLYMYFTTDLGPDAFQLSFPTWYGVAGFSIIRICTSNFTKKSKFVWFCIGFHSIGGTQLAIWLLFCFKFELLQCRFVLLHVLHHLALDRFCFQYHWPKI